MSGRRVPQRRRERGAALLVALVLVLVSTMLGISAMRTSNVETLLVANEGFRQSAFRAAEAAAEQALAEVDAGSLVGGSTSSVDAVSVDERVSVSVDARLESIEHMLDNSFGLFENRLYSVSATATVGAIDARRTVIQGAAHRAPAQRN